jgi:hypothetical protein
MSLLLIVYNIVVMLLLDCLLRFLLQVLVFLSNFLVYGVSCVLILDLAVVFLLFVFWLDCVSFLLFFIYYFHFVLQFWFIDCSIVFHVCFHVFAAFMCVWYS